MTTTKEELQKRLEERRAMALVPALSDDDVDIEKLRVDIAKADATIAANEKRAREFKEADIFERLEARYSDSELARVDSVVGMWVLKIPSVAKARVIQQVALKGKLNPDAIEDFVKPCIVWCPGYEDEKLAVDGTVLELHIEKYPLLAAQLCQIAQDLAAAGAEVRGKK